MTTPSQSILKKGFSLATRAFTTSTATSVPPPLKKTHLYSYHKDIFKAKMVPFAGYEMPVLYSEGIIKEHLHTRENAGIFDVSHMGQVKIVGKDAQDFLERLTVADVKALGKGQATLSLLMNEMGGIKDDCIITKVSEDSFFVVLNAGCKEKDLDHIHEIRNSFEWKEKDITIVYDEDENSLIAV